MKSGPMRVLSLFLSLISLAWGYTENDIQLSKFEFNRYVKPQLTSIVQDYYTLITLMNPELKPLKPFYRKLTRMKTISSKLEISCQKRLKDSCKKSLLNLQEILHRSLATVDLKLDFTKKPYFSANDLLVYFDKSYKLKFQIEKLHTQTEVLFLMSLANQNVYKRVRDLNKNLAHIENLFNIYLIHISDHRFRNEFMSFWSDFIRPVSHIILHRDDMRVFKVKLTDLNMRLHFLNVALTKRNKKISKTAHTLLKVIHNRWSHILKVTLRR